MSKDTRSTTKGIKNGVNSVTCCFCDYVQPAESVPKDILPAMNICRNLRYICDGCLRSFDGLKTLTKPILDKNDEIELEIKKISEHTTALCKDFCELKQLQMNESWIGIVKQGIDAVKNDVKVVQRTLEVVNTIKERENHVIIFNLIESNRKDNDSVSAILRFLTDNSIKDDDILRVPRQGRKIDDSKTPRPVIVKFASFVIKNRVMRSISKIKSLEGEFNKIKISHDLTRDQRVELRELIADA
ncbi:hypothetical protein HELRODRAFT_158882 [Helobdella robusta]|uniref:Uncharacterized protein n=1 Tax=Helobdella robusta TaxID=6412 RepID=T1END2_HELRO|nr:hypothetical protein HELRODRAFT_158882 [Helobdella robusta]ESO12372.1 hypothetical protein HELRODRAFT_158882 [Helobdella robusta]